MLGQLGVVAGPAAAIAVLARAISFGSVILGGGVSWLLAAQSDDQPTGSSRNFATVAD